MFTLVKDIIVQGPIKLDQFLKWARVASTGGHAKMLIQSGDIKINQAVEFKRGRILKDGDYVQVNENMLFRVLYQK